MYVHMCVCVCVCVCVWKLISKTNIFVAYKKLSRKVAVFWPFVAELTQLLLCWNTSQCVELSAGGRETLHGPLQPARPPVRPALLQFHVSFWSESPQHFIS